MKLAIRSHHVLGAHERVVRLQVFCPDQRRSVGYDKCRACPRISIVPGNPSEPGACIGCTPAETAPPRSVDACTSPRQDEAIGTLSGPRVLCIHAELPVDRLANAFREWSGVELPVVDGQGRLLGTVWRDDFVRARRHASIGPTSDPPRLANDCVDHANTLHEGSSIAHAVEALASRRARTLILIQDDNAVAGVLTDLDLLRWFAHERRRLSEV
jgi:CBS domain-containing protein